MSASSISMTMLIKVDDLSDAGIVVFLEEHLKDMRSASPPGSTHALDLEGLKRPEITFWSAWDESALLGCVALKRLDDEHFELKSMRTSPLHRKKGVGQLLLQHALTEARRAGGKRVSLETGAMSFFEPARSLYEKNGFKYCSPFANYELDPNSVFMTRTL